VVASSYSGSCVAASPTQLIKDYAYDYLNRMAAYQSYAAGAVQDQATYDYDPLDRLLQETEKHGSSPTRTTDFAYLGLTNLVTQESQSGDTTKDATKFYSYDAYGHRISLRNDPEDPAKPTKDYTYAYDVHGSVSALVDEAGSVAASYGYDAYGEKDAGISGGDPDDTNPLNPYRYSARRFDSGSGTIDMGARRFGPDTARFLQPDLFLGALTNLGLSTDVLTGNRYGLAAGNPLSFLEWDGHMLIWDGAGGSSQDPKPILTPLPPGSPVTSPPTSSPLPTPTATHQPPPPRECCPAPGGFLGSLFDVVVGGARAAEDVVRAGYGGARWLLLCVGHDEERCAHGAETALTVSSEVVRNPSTIWRPCLESFQRGHGGECIGGILFDIALLKGGSAVGRALRATTGGVQATLHGAERLAQAGFTDELIALTKSGQVFRQADEATVFLKEISPDRFNFIIEGERGVITAHRNWPLKEIQGIAERYGWEWTP